MKISKITVRRGMNRPHPLKNLEPGTYSHSHIHSHVELEASLEKGDDEEECRTALGALVQAHVEADIQEQRDYHITTYENKKGEK